MSGALQPCLRRLLPARGHPQRYMWNFILAPRIRKHSSIEPVTEEFDVHLNIIRGQVSETFLWNVAEEWKEIQKPIFAYYLGDHDPAGLRIETSLISRLSHFCARPFRWRRLAITADDLADMNLLGFPVNRKHPVGAITSTGTATDASRSTP